MFMQARSFNQNLDKWNISNVETVRQMFQDAHSFNQNLSNWVLDGSVDKYCMLFEAHDFNSEIPIFKNYEKPIDELYELLGLTNL